MVAKVCPYVIIKTNRKTLVPQRVSDLSLFFFHAKSPHKRRLRRGAIIVNAKQKMSIFAEIECHFSAVSIAVYTALIHHFTCRLEACQALIYQLVSGLTGENGKYNYSIAVHVYPPFFDIPCSAKNYKIAPALTADFGVNPRLGTWIGRGWYRTACLKWIWESQSR